MADLPHLFYAHNPVFFRAAQGMWGAVHASKRVPAPLKARAAALRRRDDRGAYHDHRVGERVVALQPRLSHPVAGALEAGVM